MLLEANQRASAHGLKAPSDLALLGKTLLNLDGVARALSPGAGAMLAVQIINHDRRGRHHKSW